MVEVDTSDTSVEAISSQRFGETPKMHPVTFFSKKFSPPEKNYDVGNQELLAVKLVLEKWWLEGWKHLFVVLTDHKNLEYLCTAKTLNSQQSHCSLFFSHFSHSFNFTMEYRPGSKHTKADALSRIFFNYFLK